MIEIVWDGDIPEEDAVKNKAVEELLAPYGDLIREAMIKIQQAILKQKKMQFQDFGADEWDSEAWPDLKESTIKRKRRKGSARPEQPLYDTGTLADSLHMNESDPEDFDPHTDVPYATWTKRWLVSKGNDHFYDQLSDDELEQANELFNKYVEDALMGKI